jgi:hypothetical protein
MIRAFLPALVLLFAATPAFAVSVADATGRWICRPADPAWPQILIDHTEDAYRRCDQNTCVTFEIASIEADTARVTVHFGAGNHLAVASDGADYFETLRIGDAIVHTSGACAFNGDAPYTPATGATAK